MSKHPIVDLLPGRALGTSLVPLRLRQRAAHGDPAAADEMLDILSEAARLFTNPGEEHYLTSCSCQCGHYLRAWSAEQVRSTPSGERTRWVLVNEDPDVDDLHVMVEDSPEYTCFRCEDAIDRRIRFKDLERAGPDDQPASLDALYRQDRRDRDPHRWEL